MFEQDLYPPKHLYVTQSLMSNVLSILAIHLTDQHFMFLLNLLHIFDTKETICARVSFKQKYWFVTCQQLQNVIVISPIYFNEYLCMHSLN